MTTVAIIGAGPLGRRLAMGAARAGFRVLLEDVMPGNLHHARESIRQELSPQALPAVAFVSSIEDAVREADLVIDCVPDELESKLEILWLLDRMAPPRTVIATPTKSLDRRPGHLHLPTRQVHRHRRLTRGPHNRRKLRSSAARGPGDQRRNRGHCQRFLTRVNVAASVRRSSAQLHEKAVFRLTHSRLVPTAAIVCRSAALAGRSSPAAGGRAN